MSETIIRHKTKEHYQIKKKSPFFRGLSLVEASLVDEAYEMEYIPLVKLAGGYGLAYEKAVKMNPANLTKTSDDAVVKRKEGLGSAANTIDKIIFDENADLILIIILDGPDIIGFQFKLGRMYRAIYTIFRFYKHHKFLR